MKREGAAGRRPGAKQSAASRTQRSRAASPTPRAPAATSDARGRQTTLTARAAILVLAVASVIVAVAVPFKIWLGQRNDIASLTSQTHQTAVQLGKLTAQDRRWQQPAYIEAQARKRLHYVMPGETYRVVLGRQSRASRTAAARHHVAATDGPWYSQFWQSVQTAGAAPAGNSSH